jgi:hypothetical protein
MGKKEDENFEEKYKGELNILKSREKMRIQR